MNILNDDVFFMRLALKEAQIAADSGEIPCGAVIVLDNIVIGKAHNQTEKINDATAHAEILAITQASQYLKNWRLKNTVMYVTKEPCPMCAGAIVLSRIKRVVWGMSDPKRGGAQSRFNILKDPNLNHKVDCTVGVLQDDCMILMQNFFKNIRSNK